MRAYLLRCWTLWTRHYYSVAFDASNLRADHIHIWGSEFLMNFINHENAWSITFDQDLMKIVKRRRWWWQWKMMTTAMMEKQNKGLIVVAIHLFKPRKHDQLSQQPNQTKNIYKKKLTKLKFQKRTTYT